MRKIYEILECGNVEGLTPDLYAELLQPSEDSSKLNCQESEILDFKETFPHSMSNDYCLGIVRLCMGFYNSFGGFIVFGVNDATRATGCNNISVNIERLNKKLSELSSQHISLKHISLTSFGVDIVLVPKRKSTNSPTYLKKSVGPYRQEAVWFRRDQEVLKVTGSNSSFLFSERSFVSDPNSGIDNIDNYFPPSRATIDSFVGRIPYLVVLHEWLLKRRDKIMHLYGRGGSGKTKIAYEFAELLRRYPDCNLLGSVNRVDKVLFLTAKETELRSFDASIQNIDNHSDFANRRELIEAILLESASIDSSVDFSKLTEDALIEMLFVAFEEEAFFIVLDDIDTITTKGQDSGASIIFEAAMQSSKSSKILVTQRDTPKEWLRNSKKVEGFKSEEELIKFLKECCDKFRERFPESSDLDLIRSASDGIPLIIETIVGLAKGYSNWEKTVEHYNSIRGSEARKYLHDREYQSLEDPRSKLLLLALSFFKKATSYEDLKFVLQCTDEQLQSAISEASGMFINRVYDGDDAQYVLTETAAKFISEVADQNTHYERTRMRYKLRISGKYPSPDATVSKLIIEMKKALASKKPERCLNLIENDHGPQVEENIHYKEMKAQIYAALTIPNKIEARRLFEDCLECQHLNVYAARSWVRLEVSSENFKKIREEICPFIIASPKKKDHHSEFYSKRAYATSQIAKDLEYTSTEEAYELFDDALHDNIAAVRSNKNEKFDDALVRSSKSTAWSLVNCGTSMGPKGYNKLVKTFHKLGQANNNLDFSIVAQPFLHLVSILVEGSKDIGPSSAQRGFLVNLKGYHKSKVINFENSYFESQFNKAIIDI